MNIKQYEKRGAVASLFGSIGNCASVNHLGKNWRYPLERKSIFSKKHHFCKILIISRLYLVDS